MFEVLTSYYRQGSTFTGANRYVGDFPNRDLVRLGTNLNLKLAPEEEHSVTFPEAMKSLLSSLSYFQDTAGG